MNKENFNYQLFIREYGEERDICELAFTYMLKCFYFPKYMRLEWLKYYKEGEGEFPWGKLSEKEWEEIEKNHYWDYLDPKKREITEEFIRYSVLLTPNDGKNLNYLTDKEAKEVKKALDLVPKGWQEKQPWYPLSYCDLALDDCLIRIKWSDRVEIKEKEASELDNLINRDYGFWSLRRGGIFFAKQGEFWFADILGNCEISVKDFKKGELGKYTDWREKNIEPKKIITFPEKPNFKEIKNFSLFSAQIFTSEIQHPRKN